MIFNNNDEIEFDISNFLKKKSLESQHAQSRDLEKQSTLIILAKKMVKLQMISSDVSKY